MKGSLLILPLFLFGHFLAAQNDLIINLEGIPPITVYHGSDYNGHNQVWDIIQDEHGLIYIAATYGLHEFDGTRWRKIETSEGIVPRCFAKNKNGRIYVAGNDIIGYLFLDEFGLTHFRSLDSKLPDGIKSGDQIYVRVLGEKVFFSGVNSILVYDEKNDTIKYFDTKVRTYPNFVFKNKVHFFLDGLVAYQNDTLVQVEGADYFSDKAISDIVVYGEDSVLVMSTSHKYYYYNGDTAFRKHYFVDPFLKDKRPYRLLKLSKDYNVICYLNAGVVITDKFWSPLLHIDESTGIDKEVHKAFLDAQNNLWLTTNFGVAVVELGSKFSYFDNSTGISGDVIGFTEQDQNLLVATTTGLYYKSWKEKQNAIQRQDHQFIKIKGSDIYNDGFLANSSPPLVRAYETIGQVIDGNYQTLFAKPGGIQVQSIYLKDSSLALMVGENGSSLLLFQNDGKKWHYLKSLENDLLPKTIYNLKCDPQNDMIWGANITQLFSFNVSQDLSTIENFKLYSEEDGLPSPAYNFTTTLGQELIVSTQAGVYQFNIIEKRFEKSDILGRVFEGSGLGEIVLENDSTYWYFKNNMEKGRLQYSFEGWDTDSKMGKVLPFHSRSVYYSTGKGVLYGGTNTISFLQEGKMEDYEFKFEPLVRQLETISGKDSIIFHGAINFRDCLSGALKKKPIQLDFEQNAIRLSFSVPYYRHPDKIQYQYRLDGLDIEWSEWSNKTQKEYTNLTPGLYKFEVKTKNGFDTESANGSLYFEILPPWYQTWWAYILYILLSVGILRIILVLNSKRLKAENKRLEDIIRDRIKEIDEQKNVISQSLREKESLLKEIHHRVKNNLQIIASLLYLQSGKFENEDFKRVLEEGQGRVRSMALIHQKLYENEDLKSIPFEEYLKELIGEIRASFGMHNITLNISAKDVFFDVDTAVPLGLIINELATNAFKYAFKNDKSGSFSISLTQDNDGSFELNVSDNGIGIPEEIDIKKTKSLGLRLVRMLSQQLEGKFGFEGGQQGTMFKLKFAA